MSNKKRISKKMQKIEAKKISKFCCQLDYAGKQADKAANIFIKMANTSLQGAFSDFIRIVETSTQYQMGVDFEQINNPIFQQFVHNVKCLSGEYLPFQEICSQVPEKYYDAVEGMMKVGFRLGDAIQLLKETYEF